MKFRYFESLGRDVRDTMLRLLRDYSEALMLALLLAVIFRFFIFGSYKIANVAMEPNLKLGDFVLGYKMPYGIKVPFSNKRIGVTQPKRGEVVVFRCPGAKSQNCVKRVVAVAGDRVEIKGKNLIINGYKSAYKKSSAKIHEALAEQTKLVQLNEKWMSNPERQILISANKELAQFGAYIVPAQSFFALGDNRDFSEDSRHWGAIPYKNIESRLFLIWFSVEWFSKPNGEYSSQVRWKRIIDIVK